MLCLLFYSSFINHHHNITLQTTVNAVHIPSHALVLESYNKHFETTMFDSLSLVSVQLIDPAGLIFLKTRAVRYWIVNNQLKGANDV